LMGALLGIATVAQAGVRVNIGIGFPAPYCAPVVVAPPVCSPPQVIISPPRVVIRPGPIYYGHVYRGHWRDRDDYGRGRGWHRDYDRHNGRWGRGYGR